MKALYKRLEAVEKQLEGARPKPTAYTALVNTDGTVKLSHSKKGDQLFSNSDEFQEYVRANELEKLSPGMIHIEIVPVGTSSNEL